MLNLLQSRTGYKLHPTQVSSSHLLPSSAAFGHFCDSVSSLLCSPLLSGAPHTSRFVLPIISSSFTVIHIVKVSFLLSFTHIESCCHLLKRAAAHFTQNSGNLEAHKSRVCCQESDLFFPQLLNYLSFHFFVVLRWFALCLPPMLKKKDKMGNNYHTFA